MSTQVNSRLLASFKNISQTAGVSAVVVGCLVLVGWQFDIPALKSVLPGLAIMKANTALAFILLGVSLWFKRNEKSNRRVYIAAQSCAGITALLGLLTLGEYILGLNFRIDQVLYPDTQTVEASYPGRMSISAALNFALLGIALLFLDTEPRRDFRPAQFLALMAGAVAAIALIGYLYGVDSLYSVGPYSSMSLHTAFGFAVLSLGILCARPQRGFMEIAVTETVGGILLRRLMPFITVILVVTGWLRLRGQQAGFYDTNFGLGLMVLFSAASLSVVLWLSAGWLNRVDTERTQVEEKLHNTEERYRRFFENMHEIFVVQEIIADESGKPIDLRFIDINPAAERFMGRTRNEIIGRSRSELSGRADPEGVEMASRVASTGTPFHMARYSPGFGGWFESFTYSLGSGMVATLSLDITERKQDEIALHESEAHKSAILESALDCIITIDHQGYILEFNPAAEATFGYARAEVIGKEMAELIIPPSLRERHRRGLANYLATGEGPVLEKRIELIGMRADGTELPVELTITRIKGEEPPVFTGFLRDITERKRAEEMIKGSEEHFRLIVEAAPSAIIAVGGDGKMNLVNARAQELFGYRNEELLGQPVEMLIPEHFRNRHVEDRQKFSTQPTSRSVDARRDLFGLHKDGHEVPVEIGLTPYESSEGLFTLALIVDITGRKQAEAALQRVNDELEIQVQERTAALSQANSLLQMLLDYMPDHIYFKDAQSRFIRNSKSQAKALGLSDPAEAIGKSDFDFFPHAQLSYEREQEIIRSGKPLVDQEERVVWPDGRETWVLTTKMPLVDQASQIIGTFGISRDITERKRSESALQKTKLELEAANRELEAFSYSVSHDLRSPLRTIDGFSQALLEDYGQQLPEEAQGHLARVRSAAQRMAVLIDDLLNLSRVTRSLMKSAPVDLSELAQGIATELQRSQRERSVNFSIAPNLKAQGDPHLLHAALENLLSNAWKFTSKREHAEVEFGSRDENGETIYFVRDNGAGFDMVYAGKLFGAFQRLHGMAEFPGTGIGLATVQRIIHRHGGRVWAEAEVDQGATFFFTLPSLKRTKPRTASKKQDSIARRAKEII